MNPGSKDIGAYIKSADGIKPQSASAGTINGPSFDRQDFDSAVLHGQVGAATGTPTTQSVIYKLQDSSDDSTFEDFEDGDIDAIEANDTSAELDLNLSGARRYVRVVAVVAFTGGTSPTVPIASTLTLGGARTRPV